MTHRKIVPPVTPKIVQAQPRQRMLWIMFVLAGLLFSAWYGYDFGRAQTAGDPSTEVVVGTHEAEQRIVALDQERTALQKRIATLEQDIESQQQTLAAAQATIRTLQQANKTARKSTKQEKVVIATPQQTPPATTESPARSAPTTASESAIAAAQTELSTAVQKTVRHRLKLNNIKVSATDTENAFRFDFSVAHEDANTDWVTGTIWIAVNGFIAGKPTRLAYKRISVDRRAFVKMRFRARQDVSGEVFLPANFTPENILIEAKPDQTKYKEISASLAWIVAESAESHPAAEKNQAGVPTPQAQPSTISSSQPPLGPPSIDQPGNQLEPETGTRFGR